MTDARLSNEEFLDYFTGKKTHKNYNRALDTHFHMAFHFDGYFARPWPSTGTATTSYTQQNPYFMRLIDDRRLEESDTIRQYRRRRYQPITQVICDKVTNSLRKIVKSSDWHIDYSKSESPKWMPDDMNLEKYCEKDYPYEDSLENWVYNKQMSWLLKDPNAMIVVMPLDWDVPDGELVRPFAHIISCKDVFEFKENQCAVFRSPFETSFKDKDGKSVSSPILVSVDKDMYVEFKQVAPEQFIMVEHPHNIGTMPAILMGGINKSDSVFAPFYESFVRGMLPALDSAAENSSDLTASMVQHLYPTMWYIAGEKCSACQGQGSVLKMGKQTACPSCDGMGVFSKSPYRDMIINFKKSKLDTDAQNIPLPPGGFIEKDTKPIELMKQYIDDDLCRALSAVNMEFLSNVPAKQSGIAKEFDRTEMNNFVYSVAYHLVVNILEPIYWFINELRYSTVVPDKLQRELMLPRVCVPEHYDFLIKDGLEDELIKINGSNVSPMIKDRAELNYIVSKYQDEPENLAILVCEHDHDPISNSMAMQDLQIAFTMGAIPLIDIILHNNISYFVKQLVEKDNDKKAGTKAFLHMTYIEQDEILYKMAQDKLDKMTPDEVEQTIQEMPPGIPSNDPQPADTPLQMANKETEEEPDKNRIDTLTNS